MEKGELQEEQGRYQEIQIQIQNNLFLFVTIIILIP